MPHPCPVKHCPFPARDGEVMCRDDWFRVPKRLRDNVWTQFKARPGTASHLSAIAAAVAAAEREKAHEG
jgi:hypothetical protein